MSDRVRSNNRASCYVNRQVFEHGVNSLFDENLPETLEDAIVRVDFARLTNPNDNDIFNHIVVTVYEALPTGVDGLVPSLWQWFRYVFADILDPDNDILRTNGTRTRAERLMVGNTAFLTQYDGPPAMRGQLLVRAVVNDLHRTRSGLARAFGSMVAPAPAQVPLAVTAVEPASELSPTSAPRRRSAPNSTPTSAPAIVPNQAKRRSLASTLTSTSTPAHGRATNRAPNIPPASMSKSNSAPSSTSASRSGQAPAAKSTSTTIAADQGDMEERYWCTQCPASYQKSNYRGARRRWLQSHKRSHRSLPNFDKAWKSGAMGPWTKLESRKRGRVDWCEEEPESKRKRKQMVSKAKTWKQGFQVDPKGTERAAQLADVYSDFDESFVDFTEQTRAQGKAKAKQAKKNKKNGDNEDQDKSQDDD